MIYNIFAIVAGVIFTFFIPGLCIVETFFKKLPGYFKVPLYLLSSVLFSTYVVYILALIFGYSRYVISFSFVGWGIWFLFLLWKRKKTIEIKYGHKSILLFSLFVFVLFVIVLYPAIFYKYNGYFVMSADNWQDTAMHLSIIQSISQGNFLPQAPYFAGVPLSYYYLADFHTAIISTLLNGFNPRILVLDNSMYALMFSFAVYSLAFFVTQSKRTGILSSFFAIFTGSFIFYRFFGDLFNGKSSLFTLLASGGYTMEYGKTFGMTPIVDYLLQNRPMMVGLPSVCLIVLVYLYAFKTKSRGLVLFGSLLTALVFKFQIFVFGGVLIAFCLFSLLSFVKRNIKWWIAFNLLFFVPLILFTLIEFKLFPSNISLIKLFIESFSLGVWDKTKSLVWYLGFAFGNLGILMGGVICFVFLIIFRKIETKKPQIFLLIWGLLMFVTPFALRFTIYDGDMFKFFYICIIPLSIVLSLVMTRVSKFKIGKVILIVVLTIVPLTAILTLTASFLNRNFAYSVSDYKVGIWIRNNTPAKSVFATAPTVHDPTTDIGGRLRVLSYITWPYSHGYNAGEDNVFSRLEDIKKLYGSEDEHTILGIMNKYKINYIYYGSEESNQFKGANVFFDKLRSLTKVYDSTNNGQRAEIYEKI